MKKILLPFICALFGIASSAPAATVYGIADFSPFPNGFLVRFDSATPGITTPIGPLTTSLVDIDFYPVNGLLYGINSTGDTFLVDTSTAALTLLFSPLTPLSGLTDLDFNPVADRMRLFGAVDQNYRMVPDVTTAPSAPGTAGTVIVDGNFSDPARSLVGSAYTNNFDGATTTTLYSIDNTANALMIHSVGPQFNTITQVGAGLGILVTAEGFGFDIGQDGIAYASEPLNGDFATIDLTTGVATVVGTLGFTVRTIAVQAVPEPNTVLLGLAGLGLLGLRRKR